ncbi:OadG family protein [Lachnospiraceae bacterium 62-35]
MKNVKRVLLTLCMITCLFALTACSGKTEIEAKPLDEMLAMQICQISEGLLTEIAGVEKADIKQRAEEAAEDDQKAYAEAFTSWGNLQGDTGKLVEIQDSKAEKDKNGYVCRVNAKFEKRMVEFTVYYSKEGMITSTGFVADYTTSETLTKAGLNTLMGMGTVFCVLIFISLLIGCFKFIHEWENGRNSKSAAPAAPAVSVGVPEESEDLVDDLELAAVITAAIAASAGTSADGLVVRSIRRAGNAKWKRA